MWALVESGTVKQTFNELPSKLTVSNRNYDKAELTAMSDSERKAIGIYPVATAAKLDAKFVRCDKDGKEIKAKSSKKKGDK